MQLSVLPLDAPRERRWEALHELRPKLWRLAIDVAASLALVVLVAVFLGAKEAIAGTLIATVVVWWRDIDPICQIVHSVRTRYEVTVDAASFPSVAYGLVREAITRPPGAQPQPPPFPIRGVLRVDDVSRRVTDAGMPCLRVELLDLGARRVDALVFDRPERRDALEEILEAAQVVQVDGLLDLRSPDKPILRDPRFEVDIDAFGPRPANGAGAAVNGRKEPRKASV